MKLSEMSTEQAADVLIRIADPVERMLTDESLEDAFKVCAKVYQDNGTVVRLAGNVLGRLIPKVLKDHSEDLYLVVSAMSGKTVEVVRKEKLTEFIRDCFDFVDKDFVDFFQFSTPQTTGRKTS